jgi:conserved oligomeric Golgi complex subunit 8
MADPLLELLLPYFDTPSLRHLPSTRDPVTSSYLSRLTTLPLSSLTTAEAQSLAQTSHTIQLSLQALSSRSHKSFVASSDQLSCLRSTLPEIAKSTAELRDAIPKLDEEAVRFSETYNKNAENAILDRRRKALLLSRNVDRLADVLDLPTLLSSAISSSAAPASGTVSSSTINYASALDLNAHIRRLHGLYPDSHLISSVTLQAEEAMQAMASNLICSLKTQGLKLAAAMRTISWLRRVAPDLDAPWTQPGSNREGSLGALFLVCRLANLMSMLEALEPLRELADQEITQNQAVPFKKGSNAAWSGGQQTERYLKRYIEIFREQTFAIISMFRSIFPPAADHDLRGVAVVAVGDPLQPLPSALSTFPLHLVDMLLETLKTYLPNVQDRSSRDSLLTQVLYCAGSLGRLGGDFSIILAFLEEGDEDGEEEWVEVIKKHRILASRLESMVGPRDG